MPAEVIRKVGDLADSWWKILTVVAGLVFGIYELSSVWITIAETKKDLEDFKNAVHKDNSFRDDRSDKRYERATLMYEELKSSGIKLENRVDKIDVELANERGKNEVFRELNKK